MYTAPTNIFDLIAMITIFSILIIILMLWLKSETRRENVNIRKEVELLKRHIELLEN